MHKNMGLSLQHIIMFMVSQYELLQPTWHIVRVCVIVWGTIGKFSYLCVHLSLKIIFQVKNRVYNTFYFHRLMHLKLDIQQEMKKVDKIIYFGNWDTLRQVY